METQVKKPMTRKYTSVKMVAHELRTKLIPTWERVNTHVTLHNDYVVSLILSMPAKDGKKYLVQIDLIRGALPKFANSVPETGINVEDLRDLIVMVDSPTLKKNKVGDHTVDQLFFDVEAYRVKTPAAKPKPSKKKSKKGKVKCTAIVPKQLDLHGYLEELDKRVTESIRSLLQEQDKKMEEKMDQIVDKVDGIKETVDEIKESVETGFTKLTTMFEKWGEFFIKKTEVADGDGPAAENGEV